MASSATNLYYWLVGKKGGLTGGPSKVVISAAAPKGYDFTQQVGTVGQSRATIIQELGKALPGLPTGIAAASSYSIPGVGTLKVSGPGGVAGTADNVVVTAGNVANTATNTVGKALGFLTSGQNWIRLLEVIAGAVLVVMGLHQLMGGGSVVPAPVKTAAKAAALA